jgi:hypothetical protein
VTLDHCGTQVQYDYELLITKLLTKQDAAILFKRVSLRAFTRQGESIPKIFKGISSVQSMHT